MSGTTRSKPQLLYELRAAQERKLDFPFTPTTSKLHDDENFSRHSSHNTNSIPLFDEDMMKRSPMFTPERPMLTKNSDLSEYQKRLYEMDLMKISQSKGPGRNAASDTNEYNASSKTSSPASNILDLKLALLLEIQEKLNKVIAVEDAIQSPHRCTEPVVSGSPTNSKKNLQPILTAESPKSSSGKLSRQSSPRSSSSSPSPSRRSLVQRALSGSPKRNSQRPASPLARTNSSLKTTSASSLESPQAVRSIHQCKNCSSAQDIDQEPKAEKPEEEPMLNEKPKLDEHMIDYYTNQIKALEARLDSVVETKSKSLLSIETIHRTWMVMQLGIAFTVAYVVMFHHGFSMLIPT